MKSQKHREALILYICIDMRILFSEFTCLHVKYCHLETLKISLDH